MFFYCFTSVSTIMYRDFYSCGIFVGDCEKLRLKSRTKLLRELNARLRNEDLILEVTWTCRRFLSRGGPSETNIYFFNHTKKTKVYYPSPKVYIYTESLIW